MQRTLQESIQLVETGLTDKGLQQLADIEHMLHDEEKLILAEKYYEWGIVDKALKIVEDLHDLYPEESAITVFLAEVYVDLDDEEKAISLLQTVNKEGDTYPQALLLLADLYQMQGLIEVSEQKLKEAKQLLPNELVIDFALSELYFHQGDFQKSITILKKIIQNEKIVAGVSIAHRIAESLSQTGQFEEALKFYAQAVEEQPEPHTIFGYGFTALRADQPRTAIRQFNELKDLDPHYSSLYLYLAKAYEEEGMFSESFNTVREGLKVDEFNKELFLYGGKIALKNHQKQDAIFLLREAVALDPSHIEATLTLTNILLHDEKYEEVIDLLEEVMKYGEEDPQFQWSLAKSYQETERYKDALKRYQLAYNSFKDNREFLEEYAFFLIEEGQHKEAKRLFEKILLLDPANVEIQEILMQLEDQFPN
ncbi:tetratricopeptide repeat protein [Metabacillus arenae]|uniref:Tetratricopeptide repeat protein n=1 Tax=Metabacillus arenae TaxID=2771434 RepID=A0A926RXB4_9BACI|nr:tetratricopeptide repeat protein [Metabacillus arenae]MBD1381693.1 tetratricopeptide repeat protein [Metabacillus arenae]